MMKPLHLYFYRLCLIMCCCLALSQMAFSQTTSDALMIPKNFYCAAAMYSDSYWKNYWEGTYERNNANLGTVSTHTYTFIGNYGITNKLDVLFSIPYVTTNQSAGTGKGRSGVQDLTLSLKWLAYEAELGKGIFTLHAILSGSLPLSNYEPDVLPLSIGLHDKTLALRALVNYQTGRFFVAGAGQYIRTSDVTLDQDAYYTTQEIYSNQVYMPNVTNFLFSTGFRSLKFNAEAIISQTTSHGGFDILKNGMPFPSNEMNATTAGALFKYSFDAVSGLELTAGGNYVLAGRNVGQSTTIFGGVLYVFDLSKKNTKK